MSGKMATALVVTALLVLSGCSGNGAGSPDTVDPGSDHGSADPDPGVDTVTDDPGHDGHDVETGNDGEVGQDADQDTGQDTDLETDTGLDASGDSGQDTGQEPDVVVPDGPVRAMTFNLRTAFGEIDENAWEERKALVADVVRTRRPDLIGVQEAWIFQVQFLQQEVPGYDWAGISRSAVDPEWDEFCAVFWRTDRFEAVESGTFWLGEDPDLPGSTFSPSQLYPRIVTWVKLQPRDGSRPFLFLNTHFDYKTEDFIQERSAALLVARAREIGADLPMVLTGDFNAHPGGAAWNILTGASDFEGIQGSFLDPWIELELPEAGTFHGFRGVSTGARIDWVMHSGGWKALEAEIVADPGPGDRYPSDHFPVWVDLDPPPNLPLPIPVW